MDSQSIPKHVAIIPDGNRRWARKHFIPAFKGHEVAADKTLPALIKKAFQMGIKYVTFWALSTENMKKRSPQELKNIMNLILMLLPKRLQEFKKNGIQIRVIGNINVFPEDIKSAIQKAIEETKDFNSTLVLGLNYGGKDEIVRAIQQALKNKKTSINEKSLSENLDTKDIPEPDLIIRTGGEKRLSGFMLWQSAYSELYFSDTLFPDFSPEEFEIAIKDFSNRQRRFGK